MINIFSPFLRTLGSPLIALHHQLEKWDTEGWGAWSNRPSLWKMTAQTCLEKTHETRMCWIVTKGTGCRVCQTSLSKAVSCPTSTASKMKRVGPNFSSCVSMVQIWSILWKKPHMQIYCCIFLRLIVSRDADHQLPGQGPCCPQSHKSENTQWTLGLLMLPYIRNPSSIN
jgi:hypothetical protein